MQDGFRIEKKYIIRLDTAAILRARIAPLMRVDAQAKGGAYQIRSLYFDTPDADAFREKTDGEAERSKYRLRFYNGDLGLIRLEKKEKIGDMTRKTQAIVSESVARAMQQGDYAALSEADDPLCRAFYAEAKSQRLLPAAVVDYRRVPYTYRFDNVRITLDTQVYTGMPHTFFSSMRPPFPVLENGAVILEVKTDDRIPTQLGRVLETVPRQQQSFSKYALSYARLHGIE